MAKTHDIPLPSDAGAGSGCKSTLVQCDCTKQDRQGSPWSRQRPFLLSDQGRFLKGEQASTLDLPLPRPETRQEAVCSKGSKCHGQGHRPAEEMCLGHVSDPNHRWE